MIQEGKFGVSEAVSVVSLSICSKLFYTSPGFLSRLVGTAGWQTTLVSCLTAVLLFSVILILFYIYPGKNMIEIFELTTGRVVGGLFSLLFSASLLISAGIMIRELADVMKIYVLLNTPISIVAIVFIFAVVCVSMLGLETIMRFSKLSVFIVLFSFLLVLALSIENFRFSNLFPVLGYGIVPTVQHGFLRASFYDPVMILTVFAGSLQGTKYLRKAGLRSLVISGAVVSFGLLCFSLAFPYPILQELTAPMLELARAINYGSFFQRLEPIFIFIWVIASLVAVTALFYAAVSGYSKIFRIQDTRPVILPMAICLFIVFILPDSFNELLTWLQVSREYGWIFTFGLPIVSLAVAGFRRMLDA